MNRAKPVLALLRTLLLVLAVVVVVLAPAGAQAGGGCDRPYTVRPGDTLSGIASRIGSTVAELARLNRIANPDRIYAGQVLCLPAQAGPTSPGQEPVTPGAVTPAPATPVPPTPAPATPEPRISEATSSVDLVAEYRIDTSEPDVDNTETWTLGQEGLLLKRVNFPLPSGDAIRTYAKPDQVRLESEKDAPLWWVARSRAAKPYTYTLVMVGNVDPLLSLQLTDSGILTETLRGRSSSPNVLGKGIPLADDVTLRLELVSPDGAAVPVTISALQFQPTVSDATQAQPFPAFALQALGAQPGAGYELLMVLNDDGSVGPPGTGWRTRCSNWATGGWWFRFLRRFYRC